jgi:hypothetical protein
MVRRLALERERIDAARKVGRALSRTRTAAPGRSGIRTHCTLPTGLRRLRQRLRNGNRPGNALAESKVSDARLLGCFDAHLHRYDDLGRPLAPSD